MQESNGHASFGPLAAGFALVALAATTPSIAAGADDAGAGGDGGAERSGSPVDVRLDQKLEAPEEVAIGAPMELDLEVDHPTGAEARLEPDLERSRWQLVETRRSEPSGDARTTTRITAVFQVVRPGDTTLAPQTVRVSAEEDRETIRTNPETVRVVSAIDKPEEASFRGPRPPQPVWQRDWTLAWIGGGLLAVAAVALGVLGFLRRRRSDEAEAELDRPPEEVARERLNELAEAGHLEHGEVMVFYVRLSEILRRYLGRRYGFPGTELTSAEILERLEASAALDAPQVEQIAEWLRDTDLVKFSGLVPSRDKAERQLERAAALVDETAPDRSDEEADPDRPEPAVPADDEREEAGGDQPPEEDGSRFAPGSDADGSEDDDEQPDAADREVPDDQRPNPADREAPDGEAPADRAGERTAQADEEKGDDAKPTEQE